MFLLGIESSCDETAASVLNGDGQILSNVVYSQEALHATFGGVVPELASREHLARIYPVVSQALEQANCPLDRLDAIAVTHGPGLIGSLLVGVSFARGLALQHRTPLIGINHLEGHFMAPFLESEPPRFPLVALLVSGGHTSLYLATDFGQYQVLGATLDDAAGEVFDKVARVLELGYPGGSRIDRLASQGDPQAIRFPRGMRKRGFDFSFSGLKTSVLNHVKKEGDRVKLEDLAASFQAAVVDVLVEKTLLAAQKHDAQLVVLSGGVAANSGLRRQLEAACQEAGIPLRLPPRALCTDNGAMVARAGLERFQRGMLTPTGTDVNPRLRL